MIKVFEAFAGIGTQRMALKRKNIQHEVIAISEVDEYAILSYHSIHTSNIEVEEVSEEEMQRYMEEKNIPLDIKGNRKKLTGKRLKNLYKASVASGNLGDMSGVNPDILPEIDFFTYSFPCQSISAVGKKEGLVKGSGTKSSLLWDCEKIIETVKPKYLLMENVKPLVQTKNRQHFEKWLKYLEDLGYTSFWKVLNAKEYNIPQNRERVFVVSILNYKGEYKFPDEVELTKPLKSILEKDIDPMYYIGKTRLDKIVYDKLNLKNRETEETKALLNKTQKEQQEFYKEQPIENYTFLGTINSTETAKFMGRPYPNISKTLRAGSTDTALVYECKEKSKAPYIIRRFTPLEFWRLMGISDEDFDKAKQVVTNTQLCRQAGNAIVVDVLEGIFKNMNLK